MTLLDERRRWWLVGQLFRGMGGKPGGDAVYDLEMRTILDESRRLTYFDQFRLGRRLFRRLNDEPEPEIDVFETIVQSLEAEFGKDHRPRSVKESLARLRELDREREARERAYRSSSCIFSGATRGIGSSSAVRRGHPPSGSR